MACELLAGPFDLLLGGEKVVVSGPLGIAWLQDVGLVAIVQHGTLLKGCVVQLDGTVSWRFTPYYPSHFQYNPNVETEGLAVSYLDGATPRFCDRVDSRTLYPIGDPRISLYHWAVLSDRRVVLSGNLWAVAREGADGDTAVECVLPESIGSGWISRGSRRDRLFLAGSSGFAYEYDTTNHEVTGWKRLFGTYGRRGIIFAHDLGVWLTLDRAAASPYSDQVRVWADEVTATAVSAITATPAPAVATTSALRVRVTGDGGDPAAGVLVDWSIGSGPGSLSASQSETDADGYAEVRYGAPGGSTGASLEVSAEVTI